MEWQDAGIVLTARPHGDSALIVTVLTEGHGRHAGLVRPGRNRAALQPGTHVRAVWKARLADHLGTWSLEPGYVPAGRVMAEPDRLAALASACALCEETLPERAPQPELYAALATLTELLTETVWAAAYIRWEIGLLETLGFALDLTRCAATGRTDDLVYVSPRTGRAVSREAGTPYAHRLLPLPGFLIGSGSLEAADVADGLTLTGFFLERYLLGQGHKPLPQARRRLASLAARQAGRDDAATGTAAAQPGDGSNDAGDTRFDPAPESASQTP